MLKLCAGICGTKRKKSSGEEDEDGYATVLVGSKVLVNSTEEPSLYELIPRISDVIYDDVKAGASVIPPLVYSERVLKYESREVNSLAKNIFRTSDENLYDVESVSSVSECLEYSPVEARASVIKSLFHSAPFSKDESSEDNSLAEKFSGAEGDEGNVSSPVELSGFNGSTEETHIYESIPRPSDMILDDVEAGAYVTQSLVYSAPFFLNNESREYNSLAKSGIQHDYTINSVNTVPVQDSERHSAATSLGPACVVQPDENSIQLDPNSLRANGSLNVQREATLSTETVTQHDNTINSVNTVPAQESERPSGVYAFVVQATEVISIENSIQLDPNSVTANGSLNVQREVTLSTENSIQLDPNSVRADGSLNVQRESTPSTENSIELDPNVVTANGSLNVQREATLSTEGSQEAVDDVHYETHGKIISPSIPSADAVQTRGAVGNTDSTPQIPVLIDELKELDYEQEEPNPERYRRSEYGLQGSISITNIGGAERGASGENIMRYVSKVPGSNVQLARPLGHSISMPDLSAFTDVPLCLESFKDSASNLLKPCVPSRYVMLPWLREKHAPFSQWWKEGITDRVLRHTSESNTSGIPSEIEPTSSELSEATKPIPAPRRSIIVPSKDSVGTMVNQPVLEVADGSIKEKSEVKVNNGGRAWDVKDNTFTSVVPETIEQSINTAKTDKLIMEELLVSFGANPQPHAEFVQSKMSATTQTLNASGHMNENQALEGKPELQVELAGVSCLKADQLQKLKEANPTSTPGKASFAKEAPEVDLTSEWPPKDIEEEGTLSSDLFTTTVKEESVIEHQFAMNSESNRDESHDRADVLQRAPPQEDRCERRNVHNNITDTSSTRDISASERQHDDLGDGWHPSTGELGCIAEHLSVIDDDASQRGKAIISEQCEESKDIQRTDDMSSTMEDITDMSTKTENKNQEFPFIKIEDVIDDLQRSTEERYKKKPDDFDEFIRRISRSLN